MKQTLALLALSFLCSAALADVTSLPPSEVSPEEVYTPAQLADQSLNALEKALSDRAAAQTDEQRREAEEAIAKLMNHIAANPDLRTEVEKILNNNSERTQHLKEMMSNSGVTLPQA